MKGMRFKQRLDSTGKNKLKEGGIRVCYPGYPSLKGQGRIYVRSNIYLGGVAIPPPEPQPD